MIKRAHRFNKSRFFLSFFDELKAIELNSMGQSNVKPEEGTDDNTAEEEEVEDLEDRPLRDRSGSSSTEDELEAVAASAYVCWNIIIFNHNGKKYINMETCCIHTWFDRICCIS